MSRSEASASHVAARAAIGECHSALNNLVEWHQHLYFRQSSIVRVNEPEELQRLLRERSFILNWLQEQDYLMDATDIRAIRKSLVRQQTYVQALHAVETDLLEWFRFNEAS